MHYFKPIFQKHVKNPALIFREIGEKYKLLGNFKKIFKIVDENSIDKLNF